MPVFELDDTPIHHPHHTHPANFTAVDTLPSILRPFPPPQTSGSFVACVLQSCDAREVSEVSTRSPPWNGSSSTALGRLPLACSFLCHTWVSARFRLLRFVRWLRPRGLPPFSNKPRCSRSRSVLVCPDARAGRAIRACSVAAFRGGHAKRKQNWRVWQGTLARHFSQIALAAADFRIELAFAVETVANTNR